MSVGSVEASSCVAVWPSILGFSDAMSVGSVEAEDEALLRSRALEVLRRDERRLR